MLEVEEIKRILPPLIARTRELMDEDYDRVFGYIFPPLLDKLSVLKLAERSNKGACIKEDPLFTTTSTTTEDVHGPFVRSIIDPNGGAYIKFSIRKSVAFTKTEVIKAVKMTKVYLRRVELK